MAASLAQCFNDADYVDVDAPHSAVSIFNNYENGSRPCDAGEACAEAADGTWVLDKGGIHHLDHHPQYYMEVASRLRLLRQSVRQSFEPSTRSTTWR